MELKSTAMMIRKCQQKSLCRDYSYSDICNVISYFMLYRAPLIPVLRLKGLPYTRQQKCSSVYHSENNAMFRGTAN